MTSRHLAATFVFICLHHYCFLVFKWQYFVIPRRNLLTVTWSFPVIVETLEDGRKRSQHFTVDTLHDDTTIKSLILAVNQTQPGAHANLYIDCISYGMVATPKSLKDMYKSMGNPKIEVVSIYKLFCWKMGRGAV